MVRWADRRRRWSTSTKTASMFAKCYDESVRVECNRLLHVGDARVAQLGGGELHDDDGGEVGHG